MKRIYLNFATVVLLMSTLIMSSCESNGFDLSKSVFIEDQDYPGLPIYSEWGYNTFGMYWDGKPFVSDNSELPAKIIIHPDTMNLVLNGRIDTKGFMTLQISFVGFSPDDYSDLTALNDSVVNLKSEKCIVKIKYPYQSKALTIIDGTIKFKHAQHLYVDKEFIKTILSGTINFRTFDENEPVSITNGRFDLSFGYDNFYNF